MAVTLEQVEKLREKAADLSYEEAKALLEQTDGDLLDALILLERQGRAARGGGSFTTRPGGEEEDRSEAPPHADHRRRGRGEAKAPRQVLFAFDEKDLLGWLREMWHALLSILRHSTENQLEVWRKGQRMTSIPVLILVILIIVAPWASIPLVIFGLICGCRYRFSGPDLGKERINNVMGSVSETVDDVVNQVKKGFQGKK